MYVNNLVACVLATLSLLSFHNIIFTGAENVEINMEPLESRYGRNAPFDSDVDDDDNLSSVTSSSSSLLSDAPSVQHFNISVCYLHACLASDGTIGFRRLEVPEQALHGWDAYEHPKTYLSTVTIEKVLSAFALHFTVM